MARFSSPSDPGFMSITGELKRWIEDLRLPDTKLQGFERVTRLPVKERALGKTKTEPDGITIWGDVIQSNVVNGSQTVNGNIHFGD